MKLLRTSLAHFAKQAHLHHMIGMIIVVAHASEIGHVVKHLSLFHLVAAALLLLVWVYTGPGLANEEIS